jgi:hypothetical protein
MQKNLGCFFLLLSCVPCIIFCAQPNPYQFGHTPLAILPVTLASIVNKPQVNKTQSPLINIDEIFDTTSLQTPPLPRSATGIAERNEFNRNDNHCCKTYSKQWEMSKQQVEEFLNTIYEVHLIGLEYGYLTYLTGEFTTFINLFTQNFLPVTKCDGPEKYAKKFQENSTDGDIIRRQFATLAKMFEGWVHTSKYWTKFDGIEEYAKLYHGITLAKK